MEIKWEERALQQLQRILNYYYEVAGKRTATKLADKFDKTVARLTNFPYIGPVELGLESLEYTYRSIIAYPHYKVIYRVEDNTIYVFAIWDCRQDPETMRK